MANQYLEESTGDGVPSFSARSLQIEGETQVYLKVLDGEFSGTEFLIAPHNDKFLSFSLIECPLDDEEYDEVDIEELCGAMIQKLVGDYPLQPH